ncbi:MAG TPA: carboxypeptidase-like regulatory domain-containing protein [Thermoanaerobaculia bacterium]|nr:carboxypeptidase-like regulatory domain-containing protein [Thermoanaerobaculia bacterium]
MLLAGLFLLSAAGAAPSGAGYEIAIKIEPPRAIAAISLRSGTDIVPVPIRAGKILVPANLALPWTVSSTRFEATTYTSSDLENRRPFLIRELGIVRGALQRAKWIDETHFTFILCRNRTENAEEVAFTIDRAGQFEIAVPAGVYAGVVLGNSSGTRIRSSIIVAPGRVTRIPDLDLEPTARVTLRVVDAKRKSPISGAAVTWSAPPALNSEAANILYANPWSGVTDRHGAVTFASIGPPPIPLVWRVTADGYAPQRTRALDLRDPRPVEPPDIGLRPQPTILVRAFLPRDLPGEFRDATFVLSDADEANSLRFVPSKRTAFREGELKLTADSYGPKRLSVVATAGRSIAYRDFDVLSETTRVDLMITPSVIHGRVRRNGEAVAGAIIRLADPHDARVLLALAKTGAEGDYEITTYQKGRIMLYAVAANHPGMQSYPVIHNLEIGEGADYEADFDFPRSGAAVRVVDATSGEPLMATIDKRIRFDDGHVQMGITRTDGNGRFALEGFPKATVHLYVHAPDHYAREVDLELTDEPKETEIQLDASGPVAGLVIDPEGAPVAGATIAGGYQDEMAQQPAFEAVSDSNGRFSFEYAPGIGTLFYVAAAGRCLGITTLHAGSDNVIALSPLGRGQFFVMERDAAPRKPLFVTAAQIGGGLIPIGALRALADANGLTSYQLLGTGMDGSLALPEFLQPGRYDLFVVKRDQSWIYRRIGTIAVPSAGTSFLSYSGD